jgi:alanyl-tRNA synthetase
MKEQKERSRSARKNAGADAWAGESNLLEDLSETEFLGYTEDSVNAKILAIVKNGERVQNATAGDDVTLILDRTTFYAESGGQVGDTGFITSADAIVKIEDTTKNHAKTFLHFGHIDAGSLQVGDTVVTERDQKRHQAIMRNHTAAHLLQAALRRVLGDHVEQAGQLVNEERVRFDFTHFSALTAEELSKVELLVNTVALNAIPVTCKEMPIEEAKKLGAMALFGEKYGKVVRVVSVDDFSKEFCGGTHVDNTAKLGLFKIVSESSAAAGVRRIEAVTGFGVYELLTNLQKEISETASVMKLNSITDLPSHAEQMMQQIKERDNTINELSEKLAGFQIDGLFAGAKMINGVRVCTALFSGTDSATLRTMCDKIRDKAPNMVAALIGINEGKATVAVTVGKNAMERGAHAGKIAKEVAMIAGGNGGGRPNFAMAGAKDLTKLDEALEATEGIVQKMLKPQK